MGAAVERHCAGVQFSGGMTLLIWTNYDMDVIEQCEEAIERCRERRIPPQPWFLLAVKMQRELEKAGLLREVELSREICEGCVWRRENGCAQHFEHAHVDAKRGVVLFCPNKTTQAMRESQLKMLHRKKRPYGT